LKDGDLTGQAIPVVAEPGQEAFLRVQILTGANLPAIQTQLVGDYNLPNVLVAVAVGRFFGVPEDQIKTAIESYRPSNNRSQWMEKDGNAIIMDAYNANPSSMRAAIENFALLPGTDKVMLLGAMAELGEDSIKEHQAIISLITQYPWKTVVLVGGDFGKIQHPFIQLNSSEEAAQWLQEQNFKGVQLLIKGSRSMQMEKVLR
jgi:UDP-N-acetylmuramoyl-tripeptide--D-alanyl-D-alanine ligase